MNHVGTVVGGDCLIAVARNDGSGAGAHAVNAGRHSGGVLFQQIPDGLRREHIPAAVC